MMKFMLLISYIFSRIIKLYLNFTIINIIMYYMYCVKVNFRITSSRSTYICIRLRYIFNRYYIKLIQINIYYILI